MLPPARPPKYARRSRPLVPISKRPGTVGKPIGGVDVKIAEDGEILVRGDILTAAYYGHPQDTADAFAGGWFLHRRCRGLQPQRGANVPNQPCF